MLEARNISINYGKAQILRSVSLLIDIGQIAVILGANGAGKSTMLRALNRTLPLSSGEVLLNGSSLGVFSRVEIARNIAVVAQENETKFPVTVLEFVLAGRFAHGNALGWETEKDIEVARDCIVLCDLQEFENRAMNELSGGERQRVLLARAIATEARILLLDEPTNNLDLSHQAMMLRLVKERTKTCESAAVVVTHDLNLASEFADKILLLKDGTMHAQGTPKEVLTQENLREVYGVEVLLDKNPISKNVRITTIY